MWQKNGVQCVCESGDKLTWPFMWMAEVAYFFRHTLNPRNYGKIHANLTKGKTSK